MRAVMGDITDPNVEQVVLMYAAQLGKSEILLNTIASPGPAPQWWKDAIDREQASHIVYRVQSH